MELQFSQVINPMKLNEKSTTGLADQAYQQLLELISEGKIREADIISHRDLAVRLGMSKLPIGTALKRLEREGLVKSAQRVGTRVCRIDAEAMWGMLQWRIALECQIARLACGWIDPAGADRLLDAAQKVEQLFSLSYKNAFQADVEFHLLLGDLCGCRRLREELDRLNIYYIKMVICEAVSAATQKPPFPPPDHQTLAQAILSGPPEEAEKCMREHLENSTSLYGFVQWYRQSQQRKKEMIL
jgi:DNA-binding GntR family transcriptional regulator